MSYAASAALQSALYQHLTTAPALAAVPVFDAQPASPPGTFVLIGPEEARSRPDAEGGVSEHRLTVSVITNESGFLAAKLIAVIISDRLDEGLPGLTRGRLISLHFEQARAKRLDQGQHRRIDLRFRASVDI